MTIAAGRRSNRDSAAELCLVGRNPVGRWVVQMAAGTNRGAPVYRTYYEHGIDTILAMHIDDRHLRELEQLQLTPSSSQGSKLSWVPEL